MARWAMAGLAVLLLAGCMRTPGPSAGPGGIGRPADRVAANDKAAAPPSAAQPWRDPDAPAETGASVPWRDPDTAAVAPPAGAAECRPYSERAMIDGQPQDVHGTACRQPDGSWRIRR